MNILVIGLGSMGKRRIRLIKELYPSYIIYGVDGRQDRRIEAESLGVICEECIERVIASVKIDCAFVCTSPLQHNDLIKKCLNYEMNVFTELNLISDGYDENIRLSKEKKCVLFLSSTFLYREEIKYIQNKIKNIEKCNYVYHVGQYLPDWHPWENYNNFFVGDKRTNGCREIMAVELPWIVKTFGNIESFNVNSDKLTNLKIDYKDNYMIQVTHKTGNKGMLIFDVVSPVAVRKLEVYAENMYYQWDGTPDKLFEFDSYTRKLNKVILNEKEEHQDGYCSFIVENAYKNEIIEFFDVVLNNKKTLYGFQDDKEILDIIDKLEA